MHIPKNQSKQIIRLLRKLGFFEIKGRRLSLTDKGKGLIAEVDKNG